MQQSNQTRGYDEPEPKPEPVECIEPLKYTGVAMFVVGFVISGVFMIVAAAELDKNRTEQDDLQTYVIISAVGMIVALVGLFLVEPNGVCADRERGQRYFGLMLVLIGFGAAAGFIMGMGINLNNLNKAGESAVQSFAYLCGVFTFIKALGWVLAYMSEMTCVSGCQPRAAAHYLFVIFSIIIGGMWMGFGYEYDWKHKNDDDAAVMLYVIGVCDLIRAIAAFLFGVF